MKKTGIFAFLVLLIGWQTLTIAHSVEASDVSHEHHCPLCLAADQNDNLNISTPSQSQTTIQISSCSFFVGTFYTPAFQANFFGRAPPFFLHT